MGWYLPPDPGPLGGAGRPAAAPLRPEPGGGRPWGAEAVEVPAGPAIERIVYEAPDGQVVPPSAANQNPPPYAPLLAAADGDRALFAPEISFPALPLRAGGAGDDPRSRAVQGPLGGRPGLREALRGRLDRTPSRRTSCSPPAMPSSAELWGPPVRVGHPPRHGHDDGRCGGSGALQQQPWRLRAPRGHRGAASGRTCRACAPQAAAPHARDRSSPGAGALRRLGMEGRGGPPRRSRRLLGPPALSAAGGAAVPSPGARRGPGGRQALARGARRRRSTGSRPRSFPSRRRW